jgi:hypothetical protein
MRAVVAVMIVGCSSVDESRVDYREPDFATFPAVADALAPSCATLDCHGQVGRNFRFYWYRGLRLRSDARPGEGTTTPDEYRMTYRSLIALEPAQLDKVMRGEASVDSLTFVRKARGTESHKGNTAIGGTDADRCLITWIAGALDSEACKRASLPK